MPPILCSKPAVPGTAQARAKVFSSLRKGWKLSVCEWKFTFISSISFTSGINQGSDALAIKPSASNITGVIYFVAILAASIAA